MSWLLFLDESGHDHQNMPYEVRGGVAVQDAQLWPFVQAMQRVELEAFGCPRREWTPRGATRSATNLDLG